MNYNNKEIENNVNYRPTFSIGVTTYNRRGMLKECIASIIKQTFSDFEVIVGNDYPLHKISAENIGINDQRIRFVNHSENMGELANANSLLGMSRGRYFTWLADDDIYNLELLQTVYNTLSKYDFPTCLFTSYIMGNKYINKTETIAEEGKIFGGRDFIRKYLSKSIKVIGCYGFFGLNYLKHVGGWEQLGDGFSPYSDNLLAIQAGLLEQVVYIDSPLIFYRTHDESISYTSKNINAYMSAQVDLVNKCLLIFANENIMEDYEVNNYLLIKWCMEDIVGVAFRSGSMSGKKMISHFLYLLRHMRTLKRPDLELKIILQFTETLLKGAFGLLCGRYSRSARSSQ